MFFFNWFEEFWTEPTIDFEFLRKVLQGLAGNEVELFFLLFIWNGDLLSFRNDAELAVVDAKQLEGIRLFEDLVTKFDDGVYVLILNISYVNLFNGFILQAIRGWLGTGFLGCSFGCSWIGTGRENAGPSAGKGTRLREWKTCRNCSEFIIYCTFANSFNNFQDHQLY